MMHIHKGSKAAVGNVWICRICDVYKALRLSLKIRFCKETTTSQIKTLRPQQTIAMHCWRGRSIENKKVHL